MFGSYVGIIEVVVLVVNTVVVPGDCSTVEVKKSSNGVTVSKSVFAERTTVVTITDVDTVKTSEAVLVMYDVAYAVEGDTVITDMTVETSVEAVDVHASAAVIPQID